MQTYKAITIKDNEKYLRQISKDVLIKDKNIDKDIEVLKTFCKENEVMAMASIQLGINKRIIYLKNTNLERINKMQTNELKDDDGYDEAKILINPVITKREGLTKYWEACASCLDNVGLVERPYKIELEYLDKDFNKHTEIFEGFPATVLSHEYDHLNGILHIDIADELLYLPKEERKILRQKNPYEVICKDQDYEVLKEKHKVLKK